MTAAPQPHLDIQDSSLSGARTWFARKGLSRPAHGRLLAGVCGAFARRYDVNVLVVRVVAIAGIVVLTPIAYVAAWILMPEEASEMLAA